MRRSRFTEHYNRYFSFVCGILYSKVGDVHASEDLAQEIFIDLYRKYDTVNNVHAWLVSAVRYAMMKHNRKSGRLPDFIEESEEAGEPHTGPDRHMEMKMIISDSIDSITGCVERLVFELVSLQDYTYPDAAAALGISKRQVKYRYGLAVRQVHRALASMGVTKAEDLL